jgi:X-Pro dipeptidyl-peptidase
MDHIVPAGHRLALIIGGTDNFEFFGATAGPQLTFNLAGTAATVPVAPDTGRPFPALP